MIMYAKGVWILGPCWHIVQSMLWKIQMLIFHSLQWRPSQTIVGRRLRSRPSLDKTRYPNWKVKVLSFMRKLTEWLEMIHPVGRGGVVRRHLCLRLAIRPQRWMLKPSYNTKVFNQVHIKPIWVSRKRHLREQWTNRLISINSHCLLHRAGKYKEIWRLQIELQYHQRGCFVHITRSSRR